MNAAVPTVFIVDDDQGVLVALSRLLRASGYETRTYASPQALFEHHEPETPGCLVLDVALPGLSGLELQRALARSGCDRPIVFITGGGDIPTTVQAMKAGAVDFLTKPFADEELLAAVRVAIERDHQSRAARAGLRSIAERLAMLTQREREVLEAVIAGRRNKQIAADLGTVEKTIKVHRARVMKKMGAESVAELVRLAAHGGVGTAEF